MRTAPYLKGLAETRARADAEYQNALEAVAHRTDYQRQVTAAYETKSATTQKAIQQATAQAQAALRARSACDQLIRKLNQGFDPALIAPVNAWQGRYGRRGALGRMVQAIVETAYPTEISTTIIGQILQQQLELTFSTPAERKEWLRVSVLGRLNYLRRIGLVERLHSAIHDGNVGRWRAIPEGRQHSDLVSLATQAGLPLTFFSANEAIQPQVAHEEEDNLPR